MIKDITNKKFNKLTAIKSAENIVYTTNNGKIIRKYMWLFQCECGNTTIINRSSVITGKTKSCGCIRGLKEQQASLNHFYRCYKKGADTRNLCFNLDIDQFKNITSQNCYYCNIAPHKERRGTPYLKGFYVGNGIDRKNNTQGYTIDNCVSCCEICNFMKRSMNEDVFLKHIKQILTNRSNQIPQIVDLLIN